MKNSKRRIIAIILLVVIGLLASAGGTFCVACWQNRVAEDVIVHRSAEPLYEVAEEEALSELVRKIQYASFAMEDQLAGKESTVYIDAYAELMDYLKQKGMDYYVKDSKHARKLTGINGYDDKYIEAHKASFRFFLKLKISSKGELSIEEIDQRFHGELSKVNYYSVYELQTLSEDFRYVEQVEMGQGGDDSYEETYAQSVRRDIPSNMEIYIFSSSDSFYTDAHAFADQQVALTPELFYQNYVMEGVAILGLCLALIAMILAVIWICVPWFGLRDTFLKRIPWEGTFILGTIAICIYIPCYIQPYCNAYINRADNLILYGRNLLTFVLLTVPVNFVTLAVMFIGMSGIMGLFIDGPRQYFTKNSWIGRLICAIGRRIRRSGLKVRRISEEIKSIYMDPSMTSVMAKVIAIYLGILFGGVILCFIIGIGILNADIFCLVLIAIFLIAYGIVVFIKISQLIRTYHKDYAIVTELVDELSKGNLDAEVKGSAGGFDPLLSKLTDVREGVRQAVAKEIKSEKMKTELITNVSHDLKTPLTAIITYTDLLKDETITQEDRQKYVAILEQKSYKLKTLIEDLFEVSKANSGTIQVDMTDIDLASLLRQAVIENEDQIQAADVLLKVSIPEEKVMLRLDGGKVYRIIDNLLSNVSKYSMPMTRAYVTMTQDDKQVMITVKNVSAAELPEDVSLLTERFVRGDAARHTEGTGLGLAICKSFTEVMGGSFELATDGDLFKATLTFTK